jgi:hypothetical protein
VTIEDIDYYLAAADSVDLSTADDTLAKLAIGVTRMGVELRAHRSWASIYGETKHRNEDGNHKEVQS